MKMTFLTPELIVLIFSNNQLMNSDERTSSSFEIFQFDFIFGRKSLICQSGK